MNRQQNAEANAFAMALLIPEEWLRRDFAEKECKGPIMDHLIAELAAKYKVSESRMALRLIDLGLIKPTSVDP